MNLVHDAYLHTMNPKSSLLCATQLSRKMHLAHDTLFVVRVTLLCLSFPNLIAEYFLKVTPEVSRSYMYINE